MIPTTVQLFILFVSIEHGRAQLPSPTPDPLCYRSTNLTGSCVPLRNGSVEVTCFGAKIPFQQTSLGLAQDANSIEAVQAILNLWSALQNFPQCWAVVQPFLCSVYLPKCEDGRGVYLPSRKWCERTRKPCHIIHDLYKGWPDFLQCDHPNFVSGCEAEQKTNYEYDSFNTSGTCESPLVRTTSPETWMSGVEGCGIPCDNPMFSSDQHRQAHIFVAVLGSICLACTLFTVLTFLIDWKNANRYPALIIFFINVCFFLGCVGWMAQFVNNARPDIVCRKEGTIRYGEPQLGSKESISCPMVFTLVYYFLVAGISWYVMLAYSWCITFTALEGSAAMGRDPAASTPRDMLRTKTAYFHLISWCSPLVLTIVCLSVSEIDGDSISGICFVGVEHPWVRVVFVLVPVGLVIILSTFFLLRGIYVLVKIRRNAPDFIPERMFSKIKATIARLGLFTFVAISLVIITFAVQTYIFVNEDRWKKSFRDYILCKANVSLTLHDTNPESVCSIKDRPSLGAMELHIFAFFGAGIAMSSLSWTKASFSAWERFFRWVFHKPSTKPIKLKRHRMIAQMFEKRKEINQGRTSISYRSSHDDPLGMKFDFNSASEDELSSNFALAMPQLIRRRGGVIFPVAGLGRRYSDSDVTSIISSRRVSRESLLEYRDAKYIIVDRDGLPAYALPDTGNSRRRGKRKRLLKTRKQRRRERLIRVDSASGSMASGQLFGSKSKSSSRKGSDSSVLSQLSAASLRFFKARRWRRSSLETDSVNSNLPAAMVTSGDGIVAPVAAIPAIKPRPKLEFGPAVKPNRNFALSSGKKGALSSSSSKKVSDKELSGLKIGLGESAMSPGGFRKPMANGGGGGGMIEMVDMDKRSQPGRADSCEDETELGPKLRSKKQDQHGQRGARDSLLRNSRGSTHSNSNTRNNSRNSQYQKLQQQPEETNDSSSTQDSSSEDSVERLMWEETLKKSASQPSKCFPTKGNQAGKKQQVKEKQKVQQLKTVTVETHHHRKLVTKEEQGEEEVGEDKEGEGGVEGDDPLHALMAEISCGNWGVLLGKSGSSSGSEFGGGGFGSGSAYNRKIHMGRPPHPPAHPPPAPPHPPPAPAPPHPPAPPPAPFPQTPRQTNPAYIPGYRNSPYNMVVAGGNVPVFNNMMDYNDNRGSFTSDGMIRHNNYPPNDYFSGGVHNPYVDISKKGYGGSLDPYMMRQNHYLGGGAFQPYVDKPYSRGWMPPYQSYSPYPPYMNNYYNAAAISPAGYDSDGRGQLSNNSGNVYPYQYSLTGSGHLPTPPPPPLGGTVPKVRRGRIVGHTTAPIQQMPHPPPQHEGGGSFYPVAPGTPQHHPPPQHEGGGSFYPVAPGTPQHHQSGYHNISIGSSGGSRLSQSHRHERERQLAREMRRPPNSNIQSQNFFSPTFDTEEEIESVSVVG